MSKPKPHLDPIIHRVRLENLTIFEITEAELDALERGDPDALYLNLGIATVSISASFLIALLTTHIEDIKTFLRLCRCMHRRYYRWPGLRPLMVAIPQACWERGARDSATTTS